MGVFHLSGLGLNPGAVTVPLTYIYFLLKQCREGDEKAIEFFKYSGEENETLKGKPEALIIFTSKEVIEGKKQVESRDNIFNTPKQKSIPSTIMKYLQNLVKALNFKDSLYGEFGVRYLYFVEVDVNNFDDCYRKIYLTLKGVKEKEIECNLIGGTNQINLSLMLASSITGVVARHYYVFEEKINFLHSPTIRSKNQKIKVPPQNWYEIPSMFLSYGEIINKLSSLGILSHPVNISLIKNILNEAGLNLKKLCGRWIEVEGEKVKPGKLLRKILKFHEKLEIEAQKLDDFSNWKSYFEEKNWLYKFVEDGKATRNS